MLQASENRSIRARWLKWRAVLCCGFLTRSGSGADEDEEAAGRSGAEDDEEDEDEDEDSEEESDEASGVDVMVMMCYKPRLVGPYGPEGSRTTAQMLKYTPF